MPVIPSFTGFAPTPNLAQSYLGGARIAQEAQQAERSLQMQQMKLQQDAQQAEMEMAARTATAERQYLRQQQEGEIEKAYKEAQIGLAQRKLEGQQQTLQLRTDQAARTMMVQQTYQKRFNELSSTMTPEAASRQAMLEINPALFGGAGTAAVRPPAQEVPGLGEISDVPGGEGEKRFRRGVGSYQLVTPPRAMLPKEVSPSAILSELSRQRKELTTVLDDPFAVNKLERTPEGKQKLTEDRRRLKQVRERIDAYIPDLSGSKTNKVRRFKYDPKSLKLVPAGD